MGVLSGRLHRVSQSPLLCGLWDRKVHSDSLTAAYQPARRVKGFFFCAGLQPTGARITAVPVDNSGPWDSAKTPSGAAKVALRRDKASGCQATRRGSLLKANPSNPRGWLGSLASGEVFTTP